MATGGLRLTIDNAAFDRMIKQAAERFGVERATRKAHVLAQQLIEFAVESPVPVGYTGELQDSGVVESDARRGEVKFGFNKIYAAFQDQPNRYGAVEIRPRVKKMLYIPLNRKGALTHAYGRNPREEGLVYGVDYVLRKKVRIPIKSYGSELGPNHYFSETISRRAQWFLNELAKAL